MVEPGKFIDFYITNKEGEKIDSYNVGDKIILVVKSVKREGSLFKINLNDPEADFKYQNEKLIDDTLEYTIHSQEDKIELEVIEQE